jgi:hypothetical protein
MQIPPSGPRTPTVTASITLATRQTRANSASLSGADRPIARIRPDAPSERRRRTRRVADRTRPPRPGSPPRSGSVATSAHPCAPIGTAVGLRLAPAGPSLRGCPSATTRESAWGSSRRARSAPGPGRGPRAHWHLGHGVSVRLVRPSPRSRAPAPPGRAGSGREPAPGLQRRRVPDHGPRAGHRRAPGAHPGPAERAAAARVLLVARPPGRGRAALGRRGAPAAGHRRAARAARPPAGPGPLGAHHAPLAPGRAPDRRTRSRAARAEARAGAARPHCGIRPTP